MRVREANKVYVCVGGCVGEVSWIYVVQGTCEIMSFLNG